MTMADRPLPADRRAALFAAQFAGRAATARPDDPAPEVPTWARAAFAGRPAPAATGGGEARPPREFRLEVDGIVTRIDLPEVGGTILEAGSVGRACHQAAMRLRLAPAVDRHAPGLRGLPPRGGGGSHRPLPALPAAARLMRRLQRLMPRSATRFDPLFRLRLYPVLSERPLPGELRDLNRRLRPLRRVLAAVPLVPAHNRLTPSALRVTGTGLQAVDWRAADMNDPAWDPAVLAQGSGMGRNPAHRLLRAVLGRPPRPAEVARLELYRALAEAITLAESDLRRGRGAGPGQEGALRAAALARLRRRAAAPTFRTAVGVLARHGRRAAP